MDKIKTKIYINNNVFIIELDNKSVRIDGACSLHKENDMKKLIKELQYNYTNLELSINNMSLEDMIIQWKFHNMLCIFPFIRKNKCNVILNPYNNNINKILHTMVSIFYL